MPLTIDDPLPPLTGGASSDSISDISVKVRNGEAVIAWSSTEPAGRKFQLYVGGRLAWSGSGRSCSVPCPASGRPVPCQILAVDDKDASADHSGVLDAPAWGGASARLEWRADPSGLERFDVYSGAVAGGAVSYAAPVGSVAASPGGVSAGGFGRGGFGYGGFGSGAADYGWGSGPLGPGTWNFGVKSVGSGGAVSAAWETSVALDGPPLPPAPDANGDRLVASYDPGTQVVTLTWGASTP